MFNFTKSLHHRSSNLNKVTAITAIAAASFLVNPLFVQAETSHNLQNIQTIADNNAAELGSIIASDHWTRIEFSKVYVDPVVVLDAKPNTQSDTYIAGVRNIDSMGFEINLKSCNSNGNPLQETINYTVLDNNELTSNNQSNTLMKQRFAWGECKTSAAI